MKTKYIVITIAIIFILIFMTPKKADAKELLTVGTIVDEVGNEIKTQAAKYGIPWTRIAAHVYQESSGRAGAVGLAGERGLMQVKQIVLTDIAQNMGVYLSWADMFDPVKNIQAGSAYLALQLRRIRNAGLGGFDEMTQAYNAGFRAFQLDHTKGYTYLQGVKQKEQLF